MLRPRALNLSATGWGSIEAVEADIDWDEPGEPKTDDRTVPIPPRLVELLRSDRGARPGRRRPVVVPDAQRPAAGAVELVAGFASGLPEGGASAAAGL